MYMDSFAAGENKAAPFDLGCSCQACAGKGSRNEFSFDASAAAAGTVPSTVRFGATPTRYTGTLTPGEAYDLIGISVVAGQTYSVALRGAGGDPINDPFLQVYNAGSALVAQDDDGGAGISSLLTFTATATGTYTLLAAAFGANDFGDYTVDVWVKPPADVVPQTFAGAVTIGEGTTYGHLETGTDQDRYKVYLEAGKLYTFELAGGADYNTDYLSVPTGELDTILTLYGPNGVAIAQNDDLDFPDDISSGLSLYVTESGFYYLNVDAYAGQTGGYTLDVTGRTINLAELDPLDAIRWKSANNIPTTVVNGQKTAYVYFGDSDENFGQTNDAGTGPMVTIDWNAFEKQQVMLALEEFERITGINYEVTENVDQATFRLLKTTSTQYGAYFFPQDPAFGGDQGVGVFNVASGGWNVGQQQSLLKGGYSFAVILHEFGHAHGLAHPHDNGGGSDVLLGVTAATGSYGVFNLNQGVYTVMSYNDAWDFHPDGPTPYTLANIDSGWSGTLSAFDIAVLQERYGVTQRNTGDDVYLLGDSNDPGTYYQTIWDTGGTDEIRYNGARAAQIDLTAATLDYTPTGGGVLSFVDDIWGGYTIANGVVIENASGGSGNDVLLGNDAANVLKGNAGDDTLMGRGGADTLDGGAGFDTVTYMDATAGVSVSLSANGGGSASGGDRLVSIEKVMGSAFSDVLQGGNAADTLFGMAGDDKVLGGNGNDVLDGGDGNDLIEGGNDNDQLFGGAGNDTLAGGNGVDVLNGGAGDDRLTGGSANDRFVFTAGGGTDTITDFRRGDQIDLSAFAGVDFGDVTISAGRIFVENGDADITILYQGDRPTEAAFIFAATGSVSAAGAGAASFAHMALV